MSRSQVRMPSTGWSEDHRIDADRDGRVTEQSVELAGENVIGAVKAREVGRRQTRQPSREQ